MENIKKIKKEKEEQLIRVLYDLGIPLQREEIFLIAEKAANIFESALIQVATAIPRSTGHMDRLHAYGDKAIDGKHPINGVWTRITQFYTDGKVLYYTNGKEEIINV